MWHKASRKFYDVAHTPAILDYVEDLLGSDFYLWGGQFFYKPAFSKSIVPWHQDSQYWPLEPSNSVTVWLAVFDTDKENSAMKIVSGSHKARYLFGLALHLEVDEVPLTPRTKTREHNIGIRDTITSARAKGFTEGAWFNESFDFVCDVWNTVIR